MVERYSGIDRKRLSSVLDYAKPGLDPVVFDRNGIIRERHRDQILSILWRFFEERGLLSRDRWPTWVRDIVIVGSMASNKWNSETDIDVHVLVDSLEMMEDVGPSLDEEEAHELIHGEWRRVLNNGILDGTKHPLEFTFEIPSIRSAVDGVNGVYSLLDDEWIREPRIVNVSEEGDYSEVIESAHRIAEGLDLNIGEIGRDLKDLDRLIETIITWSGDQRDIFKRKLEKKLSELQEEIEELVDSGKKVIDDRRKGFTETSEGNLRFKYLQEYGYLYLVSELGDFIEDDGEVTVDEIDDIRKIIRG